MITLEKVNKVYSNGLHAVKDVSLKVNKGDIFGIIGLSGAGKSSLIRLINRLEEPTSGKILINGEDILSLNKTQLLERRKKIGMIFQHFNLLSSRTVEENVAFALEIAKIIDCSLISGDSRLVIDYWSLGHFHENNLELDTISYINKVIVMRKEFEKNKGVIKHISGDINPADLGFHK